MSDWAEEKARGWLVRESPYMVADQIPSLAALLREVREDGLAGAAADGWDFGREDTLAEVRHVIEELMGGERNVLVSGDYILSRLEKLS